MPVTRKAFPRSNSASGRTLLSYVLAFIGKSYVESPILGQQKTETKRVGFDDTLI